MPFVKRSPGKKSLGKKKGQEGYGQGSAAVAFDDDVFLDEDKLVATLTTCLESPSYQPPTLPTVALELMKLSNQPDVDLADVAALLEKDALITGRILKLMGSAVYSGAQKITSMHEALVRLGLRTLRDVVMEISLNVRVFCSEDYADTMELLRRHATMTAHLSKAVCKYTPIDGEYAFMAGLMHDVGIAGTLLALSDRKGARKSPPELISIWPAVDRVHQRAGELMARHWQLPAELEASVSAHHQVLIGGQPHPLAATVCLADHLAHEAGVGVIPKAGDDLLALTEMERDCLGSHHNADRSGSKTIELACQSLDIGEAQLALLTAEALELRSKLSATGGWSNT